MRQLYDGKAKIVYEVAPGKVLIKFKDSVTALDGKKRDVLKGKGAINAAISAKLFQELESGGVRTHFIEFVKPDAILAHKLGMLKLEVVCRNYAAGSLVRRLPFLESGKRLPKPIVEFYLKDDSLGDPMLTEDHVTSIGLVDEDELMTIKSVTLQVNERLSRFLTQRGLKLVDFKLEFGKDQRGDLLVADELSCDTMRIWDLKTGSKLDKDLYREGQPLGQVLSGYRTCYEKIVGG